MAERKIKEGKIVHHDLHINLRNYLEKIKYFN